MAILIVDESICKKDGICVAECPTRVIRLQEETGYPAFVPGGEIICNRCGHCVAACPHGALKHSDIPGEDCPKIKREFVINEEQAIQFLRSRRSIRAYENKPVEREKIKRLIEAARYAPTGGNGQMVEWWVLTDKDKLNSVSEMTIESMRRNIKEQPQILTTQPYLEIIIKAWENGNDPILHNAPVLVTASAPKQAAIGMVDLTIALTYFDLLAPTMGLGTCWAGLVQLSIISSQALKELMGIPVDHRFHFPMMLGYPKAKYFQMPGRKPPRITFV